MGGSQDAQPGPQRAAIYLRISRDPDDDSDSIARQEMSCRKFVEDQGWILEPGDVFVDRNLSAYSSRRKRPQFMALTKKASQGEYQHLVIWKLDRLSRDWATWGEILKTFQGKVIVWAVQDGKNSRDDWFTISVLAAVAQKESENTQVRVRDYREKVISRGGWPGGRPPYGHDIERLPSGAVTLVTNEVEAAHLRTSMERLVAGESLSSVVKSLNAEGVKSKSGKNWTPTVMKRVLLLPAHLGYMTVGGKVHRGEDGEPVQMWDPIFSAEEHMRLRQALERLPRSVRRADAAILNSIVKCGLCGGSLLGRNNENTSASYQCQRYMQQGKSICRGTTVNVQRLNRAAVAITLRTLGAVDFERLPGAREHTVTDPRRERLAQLRMTMATQRAAMAKGGYSYPGGEDDYVRDVSKTVSEMKALDQQLEQEEPKEPTLLEALRPLAQQLGNMFVGPGPQVLERWQELPRHIQRGLIRLVFERIEAGPYDIKDRKGRPRGGWIPERVTLHFRDGTVRPLTFEDEEVPTDLSRLDETHEVDEERTAWIFGEAEGLFLEDEADDAEAIEDHGFDPKGNPL